MVAARRRRRKGTCIQMLLLPRRTPRRPRARSRPRLSPSLCLSHTFDVMALGGKDGIWPATAAAKPDEGGAKFLPNQTGCFRLDTQQSLFKTFIYRT